MRVTYQYLLALTMFACPISGAAQELPPKALTPLNIEKPYVSDNYRFLAPILKERKIIQLGESIHVTRELPKARIALVKFLHEELGFDVLAMEGSALEAWLAMDGLLHASGQQNPLQAAEIAQQTAWFGLWQTDAMLELMQYVASTLHTDNPLYLTSFDMQLGSARLYRGEELWRKFMTTLEAYSGSEFPQRDATLAKLKNFTLSTPERGDVCRNPQALAEARASVATLEDWIIRSVALKVGKATLPIHQRALLTLGDNIRDQIDLCAYAAQNAVHDAYQVKRDLLASENVRQLQNVVSARQKAILWAHHSHVHYNSTGKNVASMGEHLKKALGDQVFTIGSFAGEGTITGVDDAEFWPIFEIAVHPKVLGKIENSLSRFGADAYFLDLTQLSPSQLESFGWNSPSTMVWEGRSVVAGNLAQDFDGVLYVDQVTPQPLKFLDSPLLRFFTKANSIYVQHKIITLVLLVVVVTLGLYFIVRGLRRLLAHRRARKNLLTENR